MSWTDRVPHAGLPAAADANFVTHAGWIHRRVPGMRLEERPELVLADSGLPCDTFNIVCRAQLERPAASERIQAAIDYFAAQGRPFSWWRGPADRPTELDELLLAAGLQPAETDLAMAADLASLRVDDPAPEGLEIRRVRSAAELDHFAHIVAANWTPPDEDVVRFYALAAPALLDAAAPLWFYVGYLDGEPASAAELTVGDGVAGLYSVCTLSAFRRRGFGSALTLRPLLDARAAGFSTAVLQAAPGGVNIYSRLGFEQFGWVREYKPGVCEG